MFKQMHSNARHQRLLRAADHLVREAIIAGRPVKSVAPRHVVALVFGRHQIRMDETEAREYLNAALILHNYDVPTEEK